MRTIEQALKAFNLNGNFTHSQLEGAYNLKSTLTSLNCRSKKEEEIMKKQDQFDYQLLIIFEYLKGVFNDIELEKQKVFHISKEVEEFYNQEPYCNIELQLFESIKSAMENLDAELEYICTVQGLKSELETFKQAKDKSYRTFINNMLYGKDEEEHHEIIGGKDLEKIISMKELILTAHTIVVNKNNMLQDTKAKLDEQYKPGTIEYSNGAKYYIKMRLAKSYEDMKKIYEEVNTKMFIKKNENKKTSSR